MTTPSPLAASRGKSPPERQVQPIGRTRRRDRMSDLVYDELLSAIRNVRLNPGAMLSEIELSTQLGVSRTPLREAISRLVEQGLVVVEAQVGTRVAQIDLGAVEEACFIRGALEAEAFRSACRYGDRDVGKLRASLAQQHLAVAAKDVDRFFEAEEEFHQEVFRLSGHPNVWNVVRRVKVQMDRLRRLLLPEVFTTLAIVHEHERIVDLLELGDAETGSLLIHEHSRYILGVVPELRAKYPDFFSEP